MIFFYSFTFLFRNRKTFEIEINGNRSRLYDFIVDPKHNLYRSRMNTSTKQQNSLEPHALYDASSAGNYSLTLERRSNCNLRTPNDCHTVNKSLVITFWSKLSNHRWFAMNIASVFPQQYFDYIVMIHDNSSWNHHPVYDKAIWIHVEDQQRFWFVKRFISSHILRAYKFIWVVDDDARFNFNTRVYECIIEKFQIFLSAPGRGTGTVIHNITRKSSKYISHIGRWTDFVEIGPMFIAQKLAAICIWNLLSEKVGLGYGLDEIWCRVLNSRCFPESSPSRICAILDSFLVHHDSTGINTLEMGLSELLAYQQYYQNYSSKKFVFKPIASNSLHLDLCKASLSREI